MYMCCGSLGRGRESFPCSGKGLCPKISWQSLVTTVRVEHMLEDVKIRDVTHVTFITHERVCLNWRVSPESLHNVSSLSSTSVIIRFCDHTGLAHTDGGCHAILRRWSTGAERHLAVVSAHAGWPTHVQSPVIIVTVIRMTMYGVRTAVSSLIRQSFQSNNSGLGILAIAVNKVTTRWGNWNALALHDDA